jgi:sulfide dehydrogenase [flavocytochrome c] flavoprotein subunit
MAGWKRRQFLQALAAGGPALVSGACATPGARSGRARVLVIGGGYGGATAAKYLRLFDPGLDVALVAPGEARFACPGSNEVIAGWRSLPELGVDLTPLARDYGVRQIRERAAAIDPARRLLRLEAGGTLSYDRLVVSPGVDMRWDAVPGYDEKAAEILPHAWQAGEQTLLLRRQLEAMADGGVVVVSVPANPYRCPPGPYERACLIARYLQRFKPRSKLLILDAKTQFTKQALFTRAWERLYPGLVEWLPYTQTGALERIDAKERAAVTEFETFRADVLNVIPPQHAGILARESGLSDGSGWCPVQVNDFSSTRVPDVHVIGDACIATPMPKSAFSANAQAKACAWAIVESLRGRQPAPPTLINACYSGVSEDEAVSIAAVYRSEAGQLKAVSLGETPVDGDWRREAEFARGGWRNLRADAFE